jgi:acetyl-CoA carboxylase carboxyltransferase component
MRKEYAIKGVVERFISVPLGKGSVTLHFQGGAIDSALRRDATFSTTNPVEQAIVERLPEFKKGVIRLVRTIGTEPAKVAEAGVIDEVTTLQQARQYLMDNFEVTIEELQTRANVKEVAAKMNITFPNWK